MVQCKSVEGSVDGTVNGALLGFKPDTVDGNADDGTLFGMELSVDDGTSNGAPLGNAAVVALLGSADGATTSGGAGA